MNKKVIILTVQKAPNYGASLQAYALYKYISDLGFDTFVLDLLRPVHDGYKTQKGFYSFKYLDEPYKTKIKRVFIWPLKTKIRRCLGKDSYLNSIKMYEKELERRKRRFYNFDNIISYTKPYTIQELYQHPPLADYYITGSDQLWNPTQPYPLEPFFLTFVKGKSKRISYATSIGISHLSDFVRLKFKKWLVGYDSLSLREENGVKIIQQLTDVKVEKCCDPTFLIGRHVWSDLADKRLINEPYIFLFTLAHSHELYDYADRMRKKTGLKLVVLTDIVPAEEALKDYCIVDAGPKQWLSLIKYANMVFTNSFHGSVFSIIFHKPVKTIIQNNRGARITNLFQELGIENCLIKKHNMESLDVPNIDYELIDEQFEKMRRHGIEYLNKALQ